MPPPQDGSERPAAKRLSGRQRQIVRAGSSPQGRGRRSRPLPPFPAFVGRLAAAPDEGTGRSPTVARVRDATGRRARMIGASQTVAPYADVTGSRTWNGAAFACPRLLRYRKDSSTETARSPGKESSCSNATTVLKIVPSSCCWPASRWPSSGCCAPSSMSSSGASSSPCSPRPSTMPCSAAAWAATWRR